MKTSTEGIGTTAQRRTSAWPRYDAAIGGLRNYWYPVAWSSSVGRRPVAVRLLDEPIVLLRERGQVHALADQCPHRGIPLSVGRQEFPGTWSCRYHGWTFDLETGVLKAALTDGPDSPICNKVRVKTYPVAERAGRIGRVSLNHWAGCRITFLGPSVFDAAREKVRICLVSH